LPTGRLRFAGPAPGGPEAGQRDNVSLLSRCRIDRYNQFAGSRVMQPLRQVDRPPAGAAPGAAQRQAACLFRLI